MELEIKRLSPELADDYVHFFDITPHDEYVDAHKCYCVCWCADDYEGKDFSTAEKRRATAHRYVQEGIIQGYLAYHNGNPIGWCNANTKADCLKCCSWRMFMKDVHVDPQLRIKSIFCFVIAPQYQRQGVASMLLNRVVEDAGKEGFDAVEAYPNKHFQSVSADFMGPAAMYERRGFLTVAQTEQKYVMRKALR